MLAVKKAFFFKKDILRQQQLVSKSYVTNENKRFWNNDNLSNKIPRTCIEWERDKWDNRHVPRGTKVEEVQTDRTSRLQLLTVVVAPVVRYLVHVRAGRTLWVAGVKNRHCETRWHRWWHPKNRFLSSFPWVFYFYFIESKGRPTYPLGTRFLFRI